jgi:hypothetical protein
MRWCNRDAYGMVLIGFCTILLSAHVCSYTLDHVEPELEEPTEQAQAVDLTNLTLDQGKPQCN